MGFRLLAWVHKHDHFFLFLFPSFSTNIYSFGMAFARALARQHLQSGDGFFARERAVLRFFFLFIAERVYTRPERLLCPYSVMVMIMVVM